MEEKDKEKEFSPLCYKIYANFGKLDEHVFSILSAVGDLLLDSKNIVVFLNLNKTKKDLIRMLKKLNVHEYFLEEIIAEQCKNQDSLLASWYCEHYDEQSQKFIEISRQNELQKVNNNLLKFLASLDTKEEKAANN